jgi:DNA-binding IclR family transcriptional regulator
VVAVGAAVRDPAGRPVAAVSVSIPSVRFRRADLPRYAEAVRAAVEEADARLRDADAAE